MKPTGKILGLYKLTHSVSGKAYMGTSIDLAKQYRYQFTLLRGNKHKSRECQELWNKDGPDLFEFSFEVFDTMEDAERICKERIASLRIKSLSLNSDVFKFDQPNIGAYRIMFPDGRFYIGSSKNIRKRIQYHTWALSHDRSNHPALAEAYKHNEGIFEVDIIEAPLAEIRELEQKLLDAHHGLAECLNFSKNAKSVIDDLWANPAYREKMIVGAAKVNKSPEARIAYGEKMKAYWATPEAKAKRMGGGNPFAKQVSVLGIVYGSVMDAVRSGVMSDTKVRRRLKDPDDKEVFYL